MLTALLILWLALQLPVAIIAGKFIKAGSLIPAHPSDSKPARVPVHRNARKGITSVPVGLLQPLDQLSDKHTDTLSTAAAGGGSSSFHEAEVANG
jgi:hypothetical protein